MCVILHLEPDASIDEEILTNAVYNNCHGWGIVVLGEQFQDGIYVEHNVPENKETDPKDIIDLLNQYSECERLLHLRWATVGEVTLDNAHPFSVYTGEDDIEGRMETYFMHNGTLNGYGKEYSSHNWAEMYNDEGEYLGDTSDSRDFATRIIEPYLRMWQGDYQDRLFIKLLREFWDFGSMGVLISNYDDVFRWGPKWNQLTTDEAVGEVWASNDSYFQRVIRGPEHERRLEIIRRKEAKEKKKKKNKVSSSEVVPYTSLDMNPIGFTDLQEICGDLPTDPAPGAVYNIIKNLTSDECALLVEKEYDGLRNDRMDIEESAVLKVLHAFVRYMNILVDDYEAATGKNVEEVLEDACKE